LQEEERETDKTSKQLPESTDSGTSKEDTPVADSIKTAEPPSESADSKADTQKEFAEVTDIKETAEPLPEKSSATDESPLKKPLAMRHVVFRASSNSFYLTITMFTTVLLYGICVIFLVPVEWLQEQNWDVFKSIKALFYLMMTTLLVFPISLLFQLLIAGMVREFKRCKWQMELGGLAAGLLLCSLFFWPGWFL
jgi:hypothetical protein